MGYPKIGQLPVLDIDGVKLVQSIAISRYAAREFGLDGGNNLSSAKCDALIDTTMDAFPSFRDALMIPDVKEKV